MEEAVGTSEEFRGSWTPCVNRKETSSDLSFIVELPGLQEMDVEVELYGGALTNKGSRKCQNDEMGIISFASRDATEVS